MHAGKEKQVKESGEMELFDVLRIVEAEIEKAKKATPS